ncbi:VOC family protein [Ferrimonas futtsuensis]|uniref:VOC family protein n=1 Tax=Ferrimonas futtsuensis TaxID=364764 RepID=UPI0003FC8FE2|nr:VOC family protein [Ferrimonas futtsuensis]
MKQSLVHVALVVRDYDEALEFYVGKLNFELIEDSYQPEQEYGMVAVFEDLYGNRWDLLQLNDDHPMALRQG